MEITAKPGVEMARTFIVVGRKVDTWTRRYIRLTQLIPHSRTVLRRSMRLNSLSPPNNP